MPVDERARRNLYDALQRSIGAEAAGTMMDHLPPGGLADLATKTDLHALADRMAALVHQEIATVYQEITKVHREIARQGRIHVFSTIGAVIAVAGLAFGRGLAT